MTTSTQKTRNNNFMLGSWNGPARLSHETASWFCECHILPCQIFFQNQTEFPFSCWPLLIRGMVVCLFPQGSHTLRKRVPTHKDLHDIFVISKCTQSFGKTRVVNIICISDRVISFFAVQSYFRTRLSTGGCPESVLNSSLLSLRVAFAFFFTF